VARARALADAWESAGHGLAVPTYASVLLRFDPLVLDPAAAEREARDAATRGVVVDARPSRTIEIPTVYDGPDLADTAARSSLSVDDLIALHARREYLAFFVGFMPGFAYCGTLDQRIVAPRLERPRERVPAGSVAIAGGQTAVYPLDSPGGWRLIGRTAVVMFDATRDRPTLVSAGDRVRFVRA
jgi:KipI family sensor histidine kinase inhibitor